MALYGDILENRRLKKQNSESAVLQRKRPINSVVVKKGDEQRLEETQMKILTHCGRVTQICVFNTVKLGTSASSP